MTPKEKEYFELSQDYSGPWNHWSTQKPRFQSVYDDMAIIYDLWKVYKWKGYTLQTHYCRLKRTKPTCDCITFYTITKWFEEFGDPREHLRWRYDHPNWEYNYTPALKSRMKVLIQREAFDSEIWLYNIKKEKHSAADQVYADMEILYDLWFKTNWRAPSLYKYYFDIKGVEPTSSLSPFERILNWFELNGRPSEYPAWIAAYPNWKAEYTPEERAKVEIAFSLREPWHHYCSQSHGIQTIYADMAIIYDIWIGSKSIKHGSIYALYFEVKGIQPTTLRAPFNTCVRWFKKNGDPRSYDQWVVDFPDWEKSYTSEIRTRIDEEIKLTAAPLSPWNHNKTINKPHLQSAYADMDLIYDLWIEHNCGSLRLLRHYFAAKNMEPNCGEGQINNLIKWFKKHGDPRHNPQWRKDFIEGDRVRGKK